MGILKRSEFLQTRGHKTIAFKDGDKGNALQKTEKKISRKQREEGKETRKERQQKERRSGKNEKGGKRLEKKWVTNKAGKLIKQTE